MFERVNDDAGASATLHALRHTAAYRMAEDPSLPLTDVQFVLGHAHLSTTQIYLTPRKEDVIRRVLAHHAEQRRQATERCPPPPAPGYRPRPLRCCSAAPDDRDLDGGVAQPGVLAGGERTASPARQGLLRRFPARPVPLRWPATTQDRVQVLQLAGSAPSGPRALRNSFHQRRRGLCLLLDWLESSPA